MTRRFILIAVFVTTLFSMSLLYVNDYFLKTAVMLKEDVSCRCKTQDTLDPYEHPLRYERNQYAGTCIDSCQYRYPQVIDSSEEEKIIRVVNTLHQKQFWIAEIPLDAITHVDILFENFAPGINHTAFRFRFRENDGIQLEAQNHNSPGTTLNAIVLSPEAAPPLANKYNLWDGFVGNYALMNRLISFETYAEMAKNLKHPLKSYHLKINLEEAQSLLTVLLLDSKNIYHNQYQLVFNNCATSVIDSSLMAKKLLRSKSWDIWDVLDPLRGIPATQPLGTIRTLQWWDLVDGENTEEI